MISKFEKILLKNKEPKDAEKSREDANEFEDEMSIDSDKMENETFREDDGGKNERSESENNTEAEIDQIRSSIEKSNGVDGGNNKERKKFKDYSFSDFGDSKFKDNKIILSEEENKEIKEKITGIKQSDRFRSPSIANGIPIAADYETQVGNFSTHTYLVELENGKKVFAVNSYPLSIIHRALDGFRNWVMGQKMYKVPNWRWKETYEKRSNVPTIENPEKNVILMPFIENINLYDLIRWNKEIDVDSMSESFSWAKDLELQDKFKMIDKIVDELKEMHQDDKTWGEVILPNMIVDENKNVIICDPENLYYNGIDDLEKKARDLTNLAFSVAGALETVGDIDSNGFEEVIEKIFNRYGSDKEAEEIKKEVAKLNSKKLNLLQKIVLPAEMCRVGVTTRENYNKIKDILSKINKNKN